MDIFDSLRRLTSAETKNIEGPLFYKKSSEAKNQLEKLEELYKAADKNIKPKIGKDINLLKYGIAGEEKIAFELKNSHLPIIILHDLYIEYSGLSAQIDYFIITQKFNLIIECKNLVGNIEVNSNGDFVRTVYYNGRYIREGIYSPITQNKRHVELFKKIRKETKGNRFNKALFEYFFDENYKTLVVLANPKTVINMKYAKKEIKNQVVRSDQLIIYINKLLNESKNERSTEKEMKDIANYVLCLHKQNKVDYTNKYFIEDIKEKDCDIQNKTILVNSTPIYEKLKEYRYKISKEESIKPFVVFNNRQLEALIEAAPKTLEDIRAIPGFGDVRCQKYGNDILEILGKYR